MMNLSRRIALVAMMLMLAIGGAWAQPGGGEGRGPGHGEGDGGGKQPGPHDGMQFDRCLGTLELSAEQQAAIQAIKDRLANAAATTREEMGSLEEALRAARENGNRERAAAIMEQMHTLQEQLKASADAANNAILEQLTDAQKAALKDCLEMRVDRGDKGRHGDRRMDCFQKIGVTEEQMAQIKAIRDQFQADHQVEMQAIRELHKQLRDARKAGDADAAAALRAQINEKMEALKAAQDALRQQILGVLTPEQLQALEDCNKDRMDHNGRHGVTNGKTAPQLD
jgi:Spy/CpxP family protein refolding chaperone